MLNVEILVSMKFGNIPITHIQTSTAKKSIG